MHWTSRRDGSYETCVDVADTFNLLSILGRNAVSYEYPPSQHTSTSMVCLKLRQVGPHRPPTYRHEC